MEESEEKKLQRTGLEALRNRGEITNTGEKVMLFINQEQAVLLK